MNIQNNDLVPNQAPAEEVKKSQAELNDTIATAVVTRVGYFASETVKLLAGLHIGTLDGNFESMFHNIFNTMVSKYSQEVNG